MNEKRKAVMKQFKTMINENNKTLAEKFIAPDA